MRSQWSRWWAGGLEHLRGEARGREAETEENLCVGALHATQNRMVQPKCQTWLNVQNAPKGGEPAHHVRNALRMRLFLIETIFYTD